MWNIQFTIAGAAERVNTECYLVLNKELAIASKETTGFAKIATMATVKNCDPAWHSLNRNVNCKLCKDRKVGFPLVYHYVNTHPTSEVFPSRVPPDVAETLRKLKGPSACEAKLIGHQVAYSQLCHFCNKLMCYSKYYWVVHMMQHIGYYGYDCSNCLEKLAKRSGHKCMKERNIEKVQQRQFEDVHLKAFLCDICNYVRFNAEDIANHLENQHIGNTKNRFTEVVFLTFPKWQKQRKVEKAKISNQIQIGDAVQGEFISLFV